LTDYLYLRLLNTPATYTGGEGKYIEVGSRSAVLQDQLKALGERYNDHVAMLADVQVRYA